MHNRTVDTEMTSVSGVSRALSALSMGRASATPGPHGGRRPWVQQPGDRTSTPLVPSPPPGFGNHSGPPRFPSPPQGPPQFTPPQGGYQVPYYQMPPVVMAQQMRIPPFWEDSPAHWFHACELEMYTHNIADPIRRLGIITSALPAAIMQKYDGVLAEAYQSADPYGHLKEEIIRRYQPSMMSRLDQIYRHPPLGGREPRDVWLRIATLAEREAQLHKDLSLKWAFLQTLPEDIRVPLTKMLELMDGRDLAEEAQRRWAAKRSAQAASKAAPVACAASTATDEEEEPQAAPVAAIQPGRKDKKKRSPGAAGGDAALGWKCLRHTKFGAKAYECDDPQNCGMAGQTARRPGNGKAGGH